MGNASRGYTATCKPSHFAQQQNGPGDVLVEGEDPLLQSDNSTLSINSTLSTLELSPAACPCNSTYVSEACCDAPSGVVYEDAKMKLGELQLEQCLVSVLTESS